MCNILRSGAIFQLGEDEEATIYTVSKAIQYFELVHAFVRLEF